MTPLNSDTLQNIGFVDAGKWVSDGDRIAYQFHTSRAGPAKVSFAIPNALYAFVQGDQVRYIGKTTRSLRKRFATYCRPGISQSTNIRCNAKIKQALSAGEDVHIFVFTPISQLRYGEFEINLAAGLEDALIERFDPPWNGHVRGKPVTEEAEREEAEQSEAPEASAEEVAPSLSVQNNQGYPFSIRLGAAYYDQGIINPGAAASRHLGEHGEPIEVTFSDGSEPVFSSINRTANPSGSVRIVGRNREFARWFQRHFRKGEEVEARVLDAHRVVLIAAKADRDQ
ncbi:hypothetical protein GCM10007276_31400 [Agaricicola taiwanensis]|uniref:GIY-YIG domain-containing protein n=1 Tax=Agaricicola taiwanensis TaxID=591372 RepID=A0A8J3DZR0_9RHOB|nr:GIY-YIG nuclease family protein [Agaricicola taiwanensis]GGE52044.1 hypothetical protein GCM10007276_31400 [Agaricicola taiwanensis]